MTKPMRFSGARLRQGRGERRIEEIAVVAGVSVQTVRRWESDAAIPDATELARIARLLGKPIDWFFVPEAA